jgi:hypothetical protein
MGAAGGTINSNNKGCRAPSRNIVVQASRSAKLLSALHLLHGQMRGHGGHWASASFEANDSSRKILVHAVIGPICQCPLSPRDFIPSDTIRRVVDQQL